MPLVVRLTSVEPAQRARNWTLRISSKRISLTSGHGVKVASFHPEDAHERLRFPDGATLRHFGVTDDDHMTRWFVADPSVMTQIKDYLNSEEVEQNAPLRLNMKESGGLFLICLGIFLSVSAILPALFFWGLSVYLYMQPVKPYGRPKEFAPIFLLALLGTSGILAGLIKVKVGIRRMELDGLDYRIVPRLLFPEGANRFAVTGACLAAFALTPLIGPLFGAAALACGIIALSQLWNQRPQPPGKVHAFVAVLVGAFCLVAGGAFYGAWLWPILKAGVGA